MSSDHEAANYLKAMCDAFASYTEGLTLTAEGWNAARKAILDLAAQLEAMKVELANADDHAEHYKKQLEAVRKDMPELTFSAFREANVRRCLKWHPDGIESWSPSDWLTAVTGELGELASLLKMRNRERDNLPGNKFSPTHKMIADEIADVFIYLDLLAAALSVDMANAVVSKFNEVSLRVGFPDRIDAALRAERLDEGKEKA